MKLLLYCTKSKIRLFFDKLKEIFTLGKIPSNNDLNGKIVAECDYEVEEIIPDDWNSDIQQWYSKELLKNSCLYALDLRDYLKYKNGYAINLENLKIFDKPKELSEFYSIHNVYGMLFTDKLKKAPQNMQRISLHEWEFGIYNSNDFAILISIRPEWLCKILNGEKTIEVRKKVLKEMIK